MPGRVRTRGQFAAFSRPTGRGQSGPLRIAYVADSAPAAPVAVAFAISRQVGNAVVRNRLRRRLRALVDHLDPQPPPGTYLIRCQPTAATLNYDELSLHLNQSLSRVSAH